MTRIFNAPPLQIPDGRYADHEEMSAFGQTLRKFVHQQEQALDDAASLTLRNQIMDFLNVLADAYNEQLVIFREAEQQRQQELVATLTQTVVLDYK